MIVLGDDGLGFLLAGLVWFGAVAFMSMVEFLVFGRRVRTGELVPWRIIGRDGRAFGAESGLTVPSGRIPAGIVRDVESVRPSVPMMKEVIEGTLGDHSENTVPAPAGLGPAFPSNTL